MYKSITTLVLCMGLVTAAWADFDDGMAAYRAKDFETAFAEFQESAIAGHETAQFNLGVMYYRGEGVERDLARAFGWIELATQHGDQSYIEAQEVLILFLSPEEIREGQRLAGELASEHDLYYRADDALLAVMEEKR